MNLLGRLINENNAISIQFLRTQLTCLKCCINCAWFRPLTDCDGPASTSGCMQRDFDNSLKHRQPVSRPIAIKNDRHLRLHLYKRPGFDPLELARSLDIAQQAADKIATQLVRRSFVCQITDRCHAGDFGTIHSIRKLPIGWLPDRGGSICVLDDLHRERINRFNSYITHCDHPVESEPFAN